MSNEWKPGDEANGHVLGEDGQWHPVPPPEQTPKKSGRGWKIMLGVAVILVVFGVIAGLAGGSDEEPAAADPGQSAVAEPEEAVPGIGDPVRDGKFEFVVTEVQTGIASVGDEFLGETAQGAYTIVTMTVTNIGDEPQTFFDSDQIAIDSQGRELEADSSAGWSVNEDAAGWLEDINPGNSITVNVVFDVAPGETITAVELHDSAFSGGVEISLEG